VFQKCVLFLLHSELNVFCWILRQLGLEVATDTAEWVYVYCVTEIMLFCKTIVVVKQQGDGEFQKNSFI
jgi:hypothetical protein